MKLQFDIVNAGFYFAIILLLTVASFYFMYFFRKNALEFNRIQRVILASLRSTSMMLLAILLLSPIFESIMHRIEKPILLIGVDNSESMFRQSPETTKSVADAVKLIQTEVSNTFEVNAIKFGNEVKNSDKFDFTDKISNYSRFFDDVSDRYFNQNVCAMIVFGDGIYNEGKNPLNSLAQAKFPIYTIAYGDTTSFADQSIVNVTNNPNVFIGNEFQAEISINFEKVTQPQTRLDVISQNKIVYSELIPIPSPNYFLTKTISLKADAAGVQRYRISLSAFEGEKNTRNNSAEMLIEVHNNKNKILVLSQGPHPDNGAFTLALKKQSNFEVTTLSLPFFDGNIKDYDAIVLNQLPSNTYQSSDYFDLIKKFKKPCLYIVGPRTSIAGFNNLLTGMTIKPTQLFEDASPMFNESFSLFSLPSNIKEVADIYPPLTTFFTEISQSGDFSNMVTQKLKGVETNNPLISIGETDGQKIAFIFGEGVWRWRLQEFQNFKTNDATDMIFVNLFNYLCMKNIRDQFTVRYKNVVPETSQMIIEAQLFNELYESVTTPDVNLVLTDSIGSTFKFLFDKKSENYQLNLGFLPSGSYQFEATTQLGDKKYSKTGKFSVQEINIEQKQLKANHQLLAQISARTGGKLFSKTEIDKVSRVLLENQNIKTKIVKEKKIRELIDWKVVFTIILMLISLEWFLRKYWGSY